jgi:hypothetical protein
MEKTANMSPPLDVILQSPETRGNIDHLFPGRILLKQPAEVPLPTLVRGTMVMTKMARLGPASYVMKAR